MRKWSVISTANSTVRHNFLVNLFDGALYSFGMSFISLATVLPVFVKKIGGNNVTIGLIPIVWTIGFNFPQIFIANYVGNLEFKKSFFLKTAFIQRVPWLLLGIITFFVLDNLKAKWAILLFFSGFTIAAIAGSINLPGWFELISKLTPLNIRGRLFAYRSLLGSIFGIIGGGLVHIILDNIPFPMNFSILFSLAFIFMMISYLFLRRLREEIPSPTITHTSYRIFIRRLPFIMRTQKNFRNFLIGDALLISALMADAFYTIAAIKKFHLSDGYAGQFLMVVMLSMIIGNLFFGHLADRFGHRLNLVLAAFSIVFACVFSLVSPTVPVYRSVFVFAAFSTSLIQISRLAIIAELSGENERSTYIALTNLLTSPFILSGLLGGWLADRYDYHVLFLLSIIMAMAAAVWFICVVREPRSAHMFTRSSSIFSNLC